MLYLYTSKAGNGWVAGTGFGGSAGSNSESATEVRASAAQTALDATVAQYIQVLTACFSNLLQ
jgi:hypothetical protein